MSADLVATSDIDINATRNEVWAALLDPAAVREYMFGTELVTDWEVGSPIAWKGEWKGKPYEDKGVVLAVSPGTMLQYSHYSPMSGAPDTPANYHTVTVRLTDDGAITHVALTQDGNSTERQRDESAGNWANILTGLKKYTEHHSG